MGHVQKMVNGAFLRGIDDNQHKFTIFHKCILEKNHRNKLIFIFIYKLLTYIYNTVTSELVRIELFGLVNSTIYK